LLPTSCLALRDCPTHAPPQISQFWLITFSISIVPSGVSASFGAPCFGIKLRYSLGHPPSNRSPCALGGICSSEIADAGELGFDRSRPHILRGCLAVHLATRTNIAWNPTSRLLAASLPHCFHTCHYCEEQSHLRIEYLWASGHSESHTSDLGIRWWFFSQRQQLSDSRNPPP
jgi:hypothetical protein